MEKLIGVTFAAILVTAVVGVSTAQHTLFSQSCSTVSFSMTNGNGLGRSAPLLLAPCHNRAGE